jgi:hypothetical protein
VRRDDVDALGGLLVAIQQDHPAPLSLQNGPPILAQRLSPQLLYCEYGNVLELDCPGGQVQLLEFPDTRPPRTCRCGWSTRLWP